MSSVARRWQPPKAQERLPLFDPPANGSKTSRAAATTMRAHAGRIADRIYELLLQAGDRGLTNDELETALGDCRAQTIAPRVLELRRAGQVEDSGQTRETRWGRMAIVWRAVRNGA